MRAEFIRRNYSLQRGRMFTLRGVNPGGWGVAGGRRGVWTGFRKV